jgi:hypothetical protein
MTTNTMLRLFSSAYVNTITGTVLGRKQSVFFCVLSWHIYGEKKRLVEINKAFVLI